MAEYIDRKATIDVVAKWFEEINLNGDICIDGLRSLPAADVVEKKTGTWCADYDGYADGKPVYDMWWCSVCGEFFDEWDNEPTWNYCPNCGAKMSGGDENV